MELRNDMILYNCYTDLGKTGTNFAREGFKRLMTDVRLRKVNCIIVKDFSRFGRDYIETGNYIQKIFPFLGVRFISVTDGFDSFSDQNDELGMNLKNLINEMYAKDIAVRVGSSKRAQWEKGSYTGGIPPYGYRAEWTDGRKCLLAEDTSSKIVKEIYKLYDEGKNMKEIAVWLYENGIHRPADYRRYGHIYRQRTGDGSNQEELQEWSRATVKLILTNPVYTGCLVQERVCGKKYRMRRKHDMESEDWSVKKNTHEAVISEEQFFRIAGRFERQAEYSGRKGNSGAEPLEEDIFGGILFCGDCGSIMGRQSSEHQFNSGEITRKYSYFCRKSRRIDDHHCDRKYITGDSLMEIVSTVLKQELLLSGMRAGELTEIIRLNGENAKRKLQRGGEEIQRRLERQTIRGSDHYIAYRKEHISRADFKEWKENNEIKVQEFKRELEENQCLLQEVDAVADRQNRHIETLLRFDRKSELTRELLSVLINKIYIFGDKRIEIRFNYKEILCLYYLSGERGVGDGQ